MSLTENIEFFCESVSASSKMELLNEVELILYNLKLEDWEMDKSVMLLCNKYSKRTIIDIIQNIQRDLAEFKGEEND